MKKILLATIGLVCILLSVILHQGMNEGSKFGITIGMIFCYLAMISKK